MFTLYFPHRGSVPTAQCLSDDDLDDQVWAAEGVLRALRSGDGQSKLLVYRMFMGYDMFVLMHLWQLSCEARRRGVHPPCHSAADDPYLRQHAQFLKIGISTTPKVPRWYGATWLHESHRSQLVLRQPRHYAWQFPRTPMMMPYLYPQNVSGHFEFTVATNVIDRRRLDTGERVIPQTMIGKYDHLQEAFA